MTMSNTNVTTDRVTFEFKHTLRSLFNRNREQMIAMVIAFVLTVVNFAIQPNGISWFSFDTYVTNGTLLVLVALAQTMVLVAGGIDLSVGGIVAVSNVLVALHFGGSPGLNFILVLLLGAVLGAFNGVIVAWLRLPPIIATLATMTVWDGVALLLMPSPGGGVPESIVNGLTGDLYNIPNSLILLIVLGVIWWLLRRTQWLTAIYALGGSDKAARIRRLPVRLTTVYAYTGSGLIASLAGIFLAALSSSGSATAGDPYVLTSLAAAVLGGIALTGGKGGYGGAVAGGFVLAALNGILFFLQLPSFLQPLIQGVMLVLVVSVLSLRRKRT